jgi:predicted dehydrogenase
MEHIRGFTSLDDARITTLCDVDSNVIGKGMKAVSAAYGSEPRYVQDLRRVLDDKSIDAVSIATPNHWHSLAAIWACQAGKDDAEADAMLTRNYRAPFVVPPKV